MISKYDFDNIPLVPGHIPLDVDSEEEEGDFGPSDPHDVGDDEGDGGGAAGQARKSPTDPLERFIQDKLIQLTSFDVERKSNLWSQLLRQSY
jgi:hypothetical protein